MSFSALLFIAHTVLAVALQGLQLPAPQGYVNDFAHVISPANAATMQRIIDDVRAKSGGEIVVVTLPDLGGRPIEEVGLRIGREWKVGQNSKPGDAARNTGVIILVVPKETSADGAGTCASKRERRRRIHHRRDDGSDPRRGDSIFSPHGLRKRHRADDAARRRALRERIQVSDR